MLVSDVQFAQSLAAALWWKQYPDRQLRCVVDSSRLIRRLQHVHGLFL
jgi:hypothetical protein